MATGAGLRPGRGITGVRWVRTYPFLIPAAVAFVVLIAVQACASPAGSGIPAAHVGLDRTWKLVPVEQPADVATQLDHPVFCSPCHSVSSTVMTDVAIGGPGLVAVGYAQPGPVAAIWTSTNGAAWRRTPDVGAATGGALQAVTAADGGLVAVGSSSSGAGAWISRDGMHWTAAPTSGDLAGRAGLTAMQAVLSWRGMLVAGGYADASADVLEAAMWTSSDGTSWRRLPDGPEWRDARVFDIAAYAGGLIAVGSAGGVDRATAAVWLSTDGRTWQRIRSPAFAAGSMRSVATDGASFVAVGIGTSDDRAVAWTSSDGRSWTRVPDGPVFQDYGMSARILSLAHLAAGWIAVGWVSSAANGSGTVWSSPDGRSWTRVSPAPAMLGGGAAGLTTLGSQVVVVGSTGWPDNITAAAWMGTPVGSTGGG